MAAPHLYIGGHIWLTTSCHAYPAGTHGIITHVYRLRAACRVRFDGRSTDELVPFVCFALVPPNTNHLPRYLQ